ncbi:MAG: glycerol-3-phosphate dehydrogenase/oxidase [Sideroxydans sp.]|nr:glycerol-3-phosphate dehydrogenase/oxidase [Sideroxydans sp.]
MKRDFAALNDEFDLLVCGGGIYGAWTAYDAVLRGLKVALVEKGDWASATSSASSKLIHGGLRYLETYDFKLVRKALRERRRLLRIAPHRVWPLRFGVPVYKNSRNGTLKLKAGLMLYDALAGGPDEQMRHAHFSSAAFFEHFPFLNQHGLKGGFTYGDAQTDDARLVLELVAGTLALGAVCVNYAELTEWCEEGGHVCGAKIRDGETGAVLQMHARQYVSTSGQWASQVSTTSGLCRMSKGVHLVLPALHMSEALLLTAPQDGRVFFCIPWYGRTLLGTTDTHFIGDINHVEVEDEEVDYLLKAANHYLKAAWQKQDVIHAYAGLRVLQQSADVHPSAVTRDWVLHTATNRVHHSIGGKITSAREDACEIVNTVCAHLGVTNACETKIQNFPWTPQESYATWCATISSRARELGVDAESIQWLMRRHGANTVHVLQLVELDAQGAARVLSDVPFIQADLQYCAQQEMVVHLADLLRRRLPLMILSRVDAINLQKIAQAVAPVLGWDSARVRTELAAPMK